MPQPQVEQQVISAFAVLEAAQEGLRRRGRYQQFLATPEEVPEANGQPFDASRRPLGEERGRDWSLVSGLQVSPARAQFAVHEYDGPQGTGYVMVARSQHGTQIWRYVKHVGPETYRDVGNEQWIMEPKEDQDG